ncbi:hypothetical protein [Klebsiella phage 05F01]|nr:hypothetical protein [Klebsiella phage 05F01]
MPNTVRFTLNTVICRKYIGSVKHRFFGPLFQIFQNREISV